MRTTLTVNDQLAKALKDSAHKSNKSFKEIVNETLRAGLAAKKTPGKARPYRLKPVSIGYVGTKFALDKALHLADALEEEKAGPQAPHEKMILVDANLLIHAVNQDSPHHDKAPLRLEELL